MTITKLVGQELRDAVFVAKETAGYQDPLALRSSAFMPPTSMFYVPDVMPKRVGHHMDRVVRCLFEWGEQLHYAALTPTLLHRKVQVSKSKLLETEETTVIDSETVFAIDNDINSILEFLKDIISDAGFLWFTPSRRFSILADEPSLYFSIAGPVDFIEQMTGQSAADVERGWERAVEEMVLVDAYYAYLRNLKPWRLI